MEHALGASHLGAQSGQGYHQYPNPSFERSDFLEVPDLSRSDEFARLSFPTGE